MNTEEIIEKLEGLTTMKLIILWNEYCEDNCLSDDVIYENNEYNLDNVFSSIDDALRAAHYGEYDYSDNYFKLDAYGNLESMNFPKDYIDIDALAEYIVEHNINL